MMNPTTLDDMILRSSRNLRNLSLMIIGVVVILLVLAARYYFNFFAGPFPISQTDILALSAPDERFQYYVSATGNDSYYSGYQYLENRGGAVIVDRSYVILDFGERWLLVQVSGDASGIQELPLTYSGSLMTMPEPVQHEVLEALILRDKTRAGIFLPFMLDARDFRSRGYLGLAAAAVVITVSLYQALVASLRLHDPLQHPAYKALRYYGDPRATAAEISDALAQDHSTIGNFHFTRDWLIAQSPASLEAARYTDLIWVYPRIAQNRNSGKVYTVMAHDRYGKTLSYTVKELQVHDLVSAILARAPWVWEAYSPEMEHQWRTQREVMITAVDQRRATLEALDNL